MQNPADTPSPPDPLLRVESWDPHACNYRLLEWAKLGAWEREGAHFQTDQPQKYDRETRLRLRLQFGRRFGINDLEKRQPRQAVVVHLDPEDQGARIQVRWCS
ncbi:MAG: hypothetical protein DWQ01_15745 [Planctomycetota bacterium]|nr:MAG: hypothetical protein DWQ01_15745 [Planctomycetota bacterium]